MKKGINIWSFAEGQSVEACMELARSAGYDGIELALGEQGELGMETTESGAGEIRRRAAEIGIELAGLATGLYWDYAFTSEDAATRRRASEIARRQIELAAWLEAKTILVIPGAVGVDFMPGSEVVRYDTAYDRALEAVSELAEHAERHGVRLALENVWNKFLLSPLEFRDFVDKVGSPGVGVYLDVGNVVATGYPEHWIDILDHRIFQVHFKDYRRQAGGLHGFVDLLAGDVDYPQVMQRLGAIGYDGYAVAEMLPPYTHHSDQIIYNTAAAMQAIMEPKEGNAHD
ncbi:sugar phosphate isomerase/epimerase [Paenibacillus sp. IB182496]|uniref:Sugar phosphate isomerase/epimerase n=1 Tax=Paenibacillus sabuli TaxID=2772509 RepID=A0A927BRV4_9BACL|nr:sugar phosphate isomerase/epimerase family protein [Paenibacillus sabuli]MBD2844761.1 sugar phosphate isomerase/epimerase [Paenibacillus sabuli]